MSDPLVTSLALQFGVSESQVTGITVFVVVTSIIGFTAYFLFGTKNHRTLSLFEEQIFLRLYDEPPGQYIPYSRIVQRFHGNTIKLDSALERLVDQGRVECRSVSGEDEFRVSELFRPRPIESTSSSS